MGGEGEEDEYPDEESELMDRLRMYPDLYEEYLEQVEELQLLDDFIYKLRSLGYSDKHIMDILEELESEAIYEANSPQYPQVPSYDQEEADEESNQFKRAHSYGYDEPDKKRHHWEYQDEEEPEKKRHDEDEEEMLQSELGADEEESGELMEELTQIEGIVRRLEQEEGWTPHQIREFFLEEFGIDLLFDDDDEVDGFYEEGDNEEAQEKEEEENEDDGEEVKRNDDEYDEEEDEDE